MPESGNNALSHQLYMKMMQIPSTNINPLASCEEEEADEPPDEPNLHITHFGYHSDGEFQKHTVLKSTPQASLLTQALTSPVLSPVDHSHFHKDLLNGFSGSSIWSLSGASTAELTDDGITSRSQSPSPPPPTLIGNFQRLLHDRKSPNSTSVDTATGNSDGSEILGVLGRKRAIRFACNAGLRENKPAVPNQFSKVTTPQKRACALRFICAQQPPKADTIQVQKPSTIRFSSLQVHTTRRDSESTITASTPRFLQPTRPITSVDPKKTIISPSNTATRFYEFASSVEETESWMQCPPTGSRLLRVDGVLEKEKKIRRLTEEAEAEVKQEAGEDDDEVEEVGADDDDDDEDEDEEDAAMDGEYDYDVVEEEEDEEDEEDNLSGNESDNEEGFASDDDDDEDDFFQYNHRFAPAPMVRRPVCCRTTSESSTESNRGGIKHREPSKIVILPDSTDFVCGTFDEDKAVEDAYVSALEEKKRAKHVLTPQDIDPSFPVSDAEDDDDENPPFCKEGYQWVRGRLSSSDEDCGTANRGILNHSPPSGAAKIRFQSPALPRRAQSPAPKRRMHSPPPAISRRDSKQTTPPMSRRNSNDNSPRPTMVRRGSRAISPPPPRNNIHITLSSRPKVERTKSLPKNIRPPVNRGRSNDVSAGQSPKGALPIGARGSRKPRRKEGLTRARQDSWTRRGEGVEKMREVGLMLGKGKQVPWLSSI